MKNIITRKKKDKLTFKYLTYILYWTRSLGVAEYCKASETALADSSILFLTQNKLNVKQIIWFSTVFQTVDDLEAKKLSYLMENKNS